MVCVGVDKCVESLYMKQTMHVLLNHLIKNKFLLVA